MIVVVEGSTENRKKTYIAIIIIPAIIVEQISQDASSSHTRPEPES